MGKDANQAPRIRWLVEPTFDDDGVQRTAGIDHLGREHGDPVPVRPPVGVGPQVDELHVALRNMFIKERARYQAAIEAEEFESEEAANDFLCEEDIFPPGNEPWEDIFEFPADQPGGAANGPALASGAVKGDTPSQTGGPPAASTSDQTASGGFGPDRTPGTPDPRTVGTPISVPGSGTSAPPVRPGDRPGRV